MFKLRALLVMAVIGVVWSFCLKASAETGINVPGDLPADEARLLKEASRRDGELAKQGFIVTQVDGPTQIELLVARSDEDHVISLWFETAQGLLEIELHGPDRQSIASWRGRAGKLQLKRKLLPGKYVVAVQARDGARVHGVIGIKGPSTGRCNFDARRLAEYGAESQNGYSWPYLLVTPVPLAADAARPARAGTFLVAPNNPGFESEDGEFLRAAAICELGFGVSARTLAIADSLGVPVLMPLFPRPEKLYLHALTRATLKNTVEPKFRRVDRQLIAMIEFARAKLAADHPVQPRVLMVGLSASGMFTNRFTVLHPERVLAAAVGSPGGWPIAPVAADQGETLPYPVGIADVDRLAERAIDLAALRRVRFFFFLGDTDTNDSVPCLDSFSAADADLINRRFGRSGLICNEPPETLVRRWWPAQRLYHTAGLNAQFKLYHGVGHEITPEMWNDILDTFRRAIGAP